MFSTTFMDPDVWVANTSTKTLNSRGEKFMFSTTFMYTEE